MSLSTCAKFSSNLPWPPVIVRKYFCVYLVLTEVTLFSDCWKIFVRRFGFNRGHTFLLDHWLSLSGGCLPVSLSPCLLQCRPRETCFFGERWCGLRSSRWINQRWQASNLCQPSISMKVGILQIFNLFHSARQCESFPDGRTCVISHGSPKYTFKTVKRHILYNQRRDVKSSDSWRSQTNCLVCSFRVTHHQKYRFMLKMARKWILPYHKMHKIAQNGLFLESRTTLLDCRCYFVHIPWWPLTCPNVLSTVLPSTNTPPIRNS